MGNNVFCKVVVRFFLLLWVSATASPVSPDSSSTSTGSDFHDEVHNSGHFVKTETLTTSINILDSRLFVLTNNK